MKKNLRLALLFAALPFITGMGFSQKDVLPERIPHPTENHSALFVDQMDVVTQCSLISIEGKTYVAGRQGMGTFVVPFERIERVVFLSINEKLRARLVVRDSDEPLELTVDPDMRMFGKTPWGTFMIRLGDLKSITMIDTVGGRQEQRVR